ncbi:MAG TPA: RNA-guided endonuclease IscB [Ktedonobacteraceae bacterium]|nr:RNA-guided endonuclease IscB [Ktedonobacteraceae bacterium]
MSEVFVLDTNKQVLNPVHPGQARLLLKQGKAAVYRRYPFSIILKRTVEQPALSPLHLKLDPGSKTTGIALVNDESGQVVWAAELSHRGEQIKRDLDKRRAARRSRRERKTRYRQPRFKNRRKKIGTLPPSLESRVCNVVTWVRRLLSLGPVRAISQELVRFDTQALDNPEIEGVQYQQGTLAGYEVREYVLCKWNHQCAYCDSRDVPLELDHVQPRARHGSNRVSNLVAACTACNQRKGQQEVGQFLHDDPARLTRILAQMKAPLKDAAAVNTTRWALYERLKTFGVPVETGSGGLTKYNRVSRGLPKTHWLDAACVGKSTPPRLLTQGVVPLHISAAGHGSRQMCGTDESGFPTRHRQRQKVYFGFQTGDLVRAVVPKGVRAGTHVGRVMVRASGSFDIRTKLGRQAGINARYCRPIQRNDGYRYQQAEPSAAAVSATQTTREGAPASSPVSRHRASPGGSR